ncbi:MAG: rod shape-determining protein RodA [Chloroflexi bacterium]|nr:rod shape-determining protein RodA [Chloroflexota bacterium]MCL5110315.1 rod shape-determining protein RodA [Chloroflexota bacterium]
MQLRLWRHFDYLLLLNTFMLLGVGMALIYSATWGGEPGLPKDDSTYRQVAYAAAGTLLMVVAIFVDYRLLSTLAWPAYIAVLGLLGLVLVGGQSSYGAQRWLDLKVIPLQPSELAKLALVVILSRYLARRENEMGQFRHVVGSLLIAVPPAGLILAQPSLGTAVVLVVIWFCMLLAAGVRIRHILILILIALALSPVLWFLMPDYQRGRVMQFLSPGSGDPLNEDYNIRQALISIGSGGLWGRGYLSGTQSQLHFLRVRHTDFIFSVLAEEFGFIGCLVLLSLFLVFLWRCLRVAALSQDAFGRFLAIGIASYIMFQAFVNVGMNVRLLPVVGMPLPFVSFGGSSLATALLAIGLLQSVVMRHKRLEF